MPEYDATGDPEVSFRARRQADDDQIRNEAQPFLGLPHGRASRRHYTLVSRMIATTLADGTAVGQSYDGEGRLAAEVDRSGRTTTFSYDALGRR